MAKKNRENKETNTPPKGLQKLFGGLFAHKTSGEKPGDDFTPALSHTKSAGANAVGAQAPSRAVVAAAAAPKKQEESKEKEPLQKKDDTVRENLENRVLLRGNKLYELYCKMNGTPMPAAKPTARFNLSLMMQNEIAPDAEERTWLKQIERELHMMPQYATQKADYSKDDSPPVYPIDTYAFVRVSADNMSAYLFLLPPLDGGQPLPSQWVHRLLDERKVVFGINDAAIKAACQYGCYLQLIKIAQGTPPTKGMDGEVEDFFSREVEVQLTVQDDNTVDFKDLGWLQTVREGEVLCDILMPTKGSPGKDVFARQVPATNGRPAVPPSGVGTHMRDDGTALLASLDGILTFANGVFRVDPLLIIKADVDNAIGNLDMVGDILIYGDVREGYSVVASGNITVQGMVEGAQLNAGGDIRVSLGINGNKNGYVQAGGNVLAGFIENARVDAQGMISCQSIVNSTVRSNTYISATKGRGAIVGGNVRALQYIEAKIIGNENSRMLMMTLGATTSILQEMEEFEEKYYLLAEEIAKKEKNIEYLSSMPTVLSYEDASLLDDLRQGVKMQQMQLGNLRRRITVLARKQPNYSNCYLKAKTLYPPLQLVIGDMAAELRQPLKNATVRRQGDEIVVKEENARYSK